MEQTASFLQEMGKKREEEEKTYARFQKDYQKAAVLSTHFETLARAEAQLKDLLGREEE